MVITIAGAGANWYLFVSVAAGNGFPAYDGYMGPFFSFAEAEAYAAAVAGDGATALFDL